jgi:hypothetical protein
MNDTIKGIIIVVAITSMLVVGATTTFPIMQNSFASKKSDSKRAERDPNTKASPPCNSSTVGGQPATRVGGGTGDCTAFFPFSSGSPASFSLQCMRIHGKQIRDQSGIVCTFPQ